MRITRRAKKIAFFVTLGACLVGLAVALNVTWVVLNWRAFVPLVLGVIFFGLIIAGLIVYTVFLVREIHRNEQQDSFLNAVTHELKTPIASIRLYLETLEEVLPGKKKLIIDTKAGRRQLMLLRDGIALPNGLRPLPE